MIYLVLGCRGVLAGVFLVSLFGKLRGRAAYREFVLATATLLSTTRASARLLAPPTIAAEIVVVCALAVEPLVRPGFFMAALLLSCFTAALIRALRHGTTAPCRCFGSSTAPIGVRHVVRNIVLIAVATTGVLADLTLTAHQYDLAAVALTALAVLPCVLLITHLDDLVDLFR